MGTPKLSPELLLETLKVWEATGRSNTETGKVFGVKANTITHRINEAKKIFPKGLPDVESSELAQWTYPREIKIKVKDSRWIVVSDLHLWPGKTPVIAEAFINLARKLKVDGIILNGDVIDGARISRHGQLRRSMAPSIDKEIEAAKSFLRRLPKVRHQLWTMGNHDARIDNYIAANASEMSDYIISLQEHFPDWKLAYAFNINGVEVRHRWRGGIHTAYTNTINSGVTMITGHTHQLQITAMRDRNGTRYGIECGMLADPFGPQFEYTEGQPNRWQQGFVVLTFDNSGLLMPPELCEIANGKPVFRGDYVAV